MRMRAAVLLVSGMVLCSCSTREEQVQVEPAARREWFEEWTGQTAGGYACAEIVAHAPARDTPVIPAMGELLNVYGAERVLHVCWTNGVERAMPTLEWYLAELPSAWHAYGVYENVPGGIDQSGLRGGPCKRVHGTVLVMKGRWITWDKPVSGEGHAGREALRAALCRQMPGVWVVPAEVRRLAMLEPAPARIDFVPRDALGLGIFGAALVARYDGPRGSVELFITYPREFTPASIEFEMLRQWLQRHDISGVQIEHGATSDLFVPDERVGYLFVTLSSNELRGVRGMQTVADARTLLARWAEKGE